MSSNEKARKATMSPTRKATLGVLIAGTIFAAALAFGSVWIVRLGVGLAIATAIFSVVLAWHESTRERQARERAALEATHAQADDLHRERQSSMAVVSSLKSRNSRISNRVEELSDTIAELREELFQLRFNNTSLTAENQLLNGHNDTLRAELKQSKTRVVALNQQLRRAEAELKALTTGQDDAEVVELPRRFEAQSSAEEAAQVEQTDLADTSEWEAVPTADELWTDGDHPTVVDMKAIALSDIALPELEQNEDERRHA